MSHRNIVHPALAPLKAKFPEVKFLVGEMRDMVTVVVPREDLVRVCTYLRDEPSLRDDMLFEVNGVDYLNYPGASHRFGVNYGLTSIGHNSRLLAEGVFGSDADDGLRQRCGMKKSWRRAIRG